MRSLLSLPFLFIGKLLFPFNNDEINIEIANMLNKWVDITEEGPLRNELISLLFATPGHLSSLIIGRTPISSSEDVPEFQLIVAYASALESNEEIANGLDAKVSTSISHLIRDRVTRNVEKKLTEKGSPRRLREITHNKVFLDELSMELIPCSQHSCSVLRDVYASEKLVRSVWSDDWFDFSGAEGSDSDIGDGSATSLDEGWDLLKTDTNLSETGPVELATPFNALDISTSASVQQWHHIFLDTNTILQSAYKVNPQWDQNTMVVSVLDSGVDRRHSTFNDSVWVNKEEICNDGVDNDNNGYVDDCYGWNFVSRNNNTIDDSGHGTGVASLIAGGIHNNYMHPMCPTCKVMPIKVLDGFSSGTISGILEGLNYSIRMGVKLSNHSYGATRGMDFPALKEAFYRSYQLGMINVAAAGNYGVSNDIMPVYPASFNIYIPNVISVASNDASGRLSPFSNYGKSSTQISAPGSNIYVADLNGGYATKNGTSFASPIVCGLLGFMWSLYPRLPASQLVSILLGSVVDSGLPLVTGGVVNPQAMIEEGSRLNGLETVNSICKTLGLGRTCGAKHPLDVFRVECLDRGAEYWVCKCKTGFKKDMEGYCADINECEVVTCPEKSRCVNFPGTYECYCSEGIWDIISGSCDMEIALGDNSVCRYGFGRHSQYTDVCVREGVPQYLPLSFYNNVLLNYSFG